MKANWRLVLAIATFLLISGCSRQSPFQVSVSATPTTTPTAAIDRGAVYDQAASDLQAFLTSWQEIGLYAAAPKYLDPSMRPNQTQKTPVLIKGTVTRIQPYEWISADHFTVMVDLNLQFLGSAAVWGNGTHTRIVTFVRPSASEPYQIMFATNDP